LTLRWNQQLVVVDWGAFGFAIHLYSNIFLQRLSSIAEPGAGLWIISLLKRTSSPDLAKLHVLQVIERLGILVEENRLCCLEAVYRLQVSDAIRVGELVPSLLLLTTTFLALLLLQADR
jgi:hypothetical protein